METNSDRHSETRWLAAMLRIGEHSRPNWTRDDLAAMLRHQLAAPLIDDIASPNGQSRKALEEAAEREPPVISYGDLLLGEQPPVELLALTKAFAKSCRSGDGELALPDEIATIVYLMSIFAALVRCSERITDLSDDALLVSLDWAQHRDWIDEPTRNLFQRGRELLQHGR
jgi:hypothetical protein